MKIPNDLCIAIRSLTDRDLNAVLRFSSDDPAVFAAAVREIAKEEKEVRTAPGTRKTITE